MLLFLQSAPRQRRKNKYSVLLYGISLATLGNNFYREDFKCRRNKTMGPVYY